MYITCVCLFSALSRRGGALQICIINAAFCFVSFCWKRGKREVTLKRIPNIDLILPGHPIINKEGTKSNLCVSRPPLLWL